MFCRAKHALSLCYICQTAPRKSIFRGAVVVCRWRVRLYVGRSCVNGLTFYSFSLAVFSPSAVVAFTIYRPGFIADVPIVRVWLLRPSEA